MNERQSRARGPRAARRPLTAVHHGIVRADDYAWLRASNWQAVMRDPSQLDPAIRAHLEAENAYAKAIMADTEELQTRLFAEMKGRIKEDDASVPAPDGAFAYYTRYVTGGQHPLFCRRPRDGGEERVLLDGNALAEPHAYFRIASVTHSPDHGLLAYAADTKGSEFYTVNVIEADTGVLVDSRIADNNGSLEWAADSRTLLYVWLDEEHRPRRVLRHRVGAETADDLLHEQDNPGYFLGLTATQDRRFLLLSVHDHETAEVSLIDSADPSAPRLVTPREPEHDYSVDHHNGRLIILTNSDGAEDYRIVEAPVDNPGRENWCEIEPHRPGRLILDVVAYRDFLVRLEREDGLPRIVVRRFDSGEEHAIAFAEEAYSLGISAGYEYDTTTLRFTYSSMTTPAQVFDYDMSVRTRVLRKTQEIPSGHDPSRYVAQRVMAPARDGETVPISLVYRKETKLDGSAPLLLYGYGAYGMSMPAGFSTNALSLVDRGFIYAIAHVRGGKDKGYRWYKEGKREKKVNTFTDFIAAAEFLAREGFTARGRIVAHGGSAGGMLMGAVANMAPELFLGIIAEVPFVDVLTTMLDASLPLTPPEWPEWGNPIESEADYRTIAAYSPYDNVRTQIYPHILALAGLTDPRVTYWEPAKWVAKLRELATSDGLILLRTNMEAGHAGASGRFERLKEVALAYAFALKIASLDALRKLCEGGPMLMSRDKSQLLIIDVQDKLIEAISGKDRVIDRCVRLVRAARTLGVPITISEQYPQGLGPTADPIRDAFANTGLVVDKVEFSCLKSDPLRERLHELRRQGRSQVVIGGIEAHVCVTQTAIDLEDQGFEAFVVSDAVGSRSKASRKLALTRLLKSGADVVDSEMVLFEWLERAGTREFKELQALVK